MTAENEAPMWEITVRDESGRIWTTYYEGGVGTAVLDSFTALMPLALGAHHPRVTVRQVPGEVL